ncbi:MAG: DegT/DnrJ/EryC1/StrS family aminotransferase [Candidatus Omnitrophica bacterium]|nr:DegT/DnrJ/EryC1/StrS family aminotransferase [Candidatus Omnitrophota bacterium]
MEKLAIYGGSPVRKSPMPARIMFGEEEKQAAMRVIEKTMTGNQALDRYGGIEVDEYEKEFAQFFGRKFATAVSSGTAAIHSALASLHLEPASEVITSPITDPGAVMPIVFQQCIPVFCDVDYHTLNPSPQSVEENITEKTGAIIVVHIAGFPAKIDQICKIAQKHKIPVIEDCAQAHGAKFKGKYAGTFGTLSAFSLMSGKHTTSGGQGGMVLTDNEDLYWDAKRFADRGKPFNSNETTNLFAGLNYRMTELEAAIGRQQLKKMLAIAEKRRKIYIQIKQGFENELKAFRIHLAEPESEPNPWFLFVHVEKEKLRVSNEILAKAISAEGIPVGQKYVVPMYQARWIIDKRTFGTSQLPWSLPQARKVDYNHACPVAEKALEDHMTLGIHEGYEDKEICDIIDAFKKVEKYFLR